MLPKQNGTNMYFFIGTVAELIKVAPVMKEMLDRDMDFKIIASGQNSIQNTEMLRLLERERIDITLHQNKIKQSAGSLFWWFLSTLPRGVKILRRELKKTARSNTLMIVHGDTISAVMGAMIARICGLRVAHIEAGLRSFSKLHPFPEEIDRIFVGYLADIHFCPYSSAIDNLEKRKGTKVNTFYNTLVDSLAFALSQNAESPMLKNLRNKKFFIFVLHRQENLFNEKLVKMLIYLVSELSNDFICVFIMHKPTRVTLEKLNLLDRIKGNPGIIVTPRVEYTEFARLLLGCEFILTDGGSNQQESSYLGKPCLILRETTESTEGVDKNMVLSKNDPEIIRSFVSDYKSYIRPVVVPETSPSKIIVDYLSEDHGRRLS